MAEPEERFLDFVGYLYQNCPRCFEYNHITWTEKYNGEDGVFAVVLRTLIWNEDRSEKVFEGFGGFSRALDLYRTNRAKFESWVNAKVQDIDFGFDGKGSHRDNRHKPPFARALREYLELVGNSRQGFLASLDTFDSPFHKLDQIYSIGPLTSFDICERLVRSNHGFFRVYPLNFHMTGGGVKRGLTMIFPNTSRIKQLETKGDELLLKLISEKKIPQEIACFELESIVCICQKPNLKKFFEDLLEGRIEPYEFAKYYSNKQAID